ncbi:MAG: HAMP domain-containing sensor histidine kinase [Colwellia sp.]
MTNFFKIRNQIQVIIALRSFAIAIQLMLILFVNIGLGYQLPWTPMITIVCLELIFTCGSYLYYRHKQLSVKKASQQAILVQICADIVFLSLLLFFSGGATNAFVSLLLIPLAIAAVTLSPFLLTVVAALAIACYSLLLWLLPISVMHGNMQGHFIAMGINFLFSALVVAIVVGNMARSINRQALAIATYRENLLKQEQVTSLGVASAQVTHQLATPIACVQLLADELSEDFPDNDTLSEMQNQLTRCRDSLSEFRMMVFDIKEQVIKEIYYHDFLEKIANNVRVNNPEVNLKLQKINNESTPRNITIKADASLLPAILNLINNAIRASKANNSLALNLTSQIIADKWLFTIRDYGKGFTLQRLNELGLKPVNSDQGFGMAVFLSHTSLERLGGKLALTNHKEGGALVTLSLPISAQ